MLKTLRANQRGLRNILLREGRTFDRYLKELEDSKKYSMEELKQLQNEKLRRTISSAYENVPYYRKKFDEIKLKPADIKTQEDLWKVPLLYKEDIRRNQKELLSVKANKMLLNKGHTSGTTGTPLHLYRDMESINFENAMIWRQWLDAGFKRGMNRATLRGDNSIPVSCSSPPFWVHNHFEKQLLLSSFHLSENNLVHYVEKISDFKPYAIQAYPSSIYVLARYLEKVDKYLKVSAVFTSSEPLYEHQRELIEKRFGCRIWDFYGMAERAISASECECHEGLHLNEEYGITEFLSSGDQGHGEGIMVGTALSNHAMPLIRYVTNDMGKPMEGLCQCGRHHQRIHPIHTKSEDMILAPDGRWVSPSIVTFIFKKLYNIHKSQLIQDDVNHLTVKLVKGENFSGEELGILKDGLQSVCGKLMKIDVVFVDDIERTKNGKYRWIISTVKNGSTAAHG